MRIQLRGPDVRDEGDYFTYVNGSGVKNGAGAYAVIQLDEHGQTDLTFDTAEDIDRLIKAACEAKRLLLATLTPHPFRPAAPQFRCAECGVHKGHHPEPPGCPAMTEVEGLDETVFLPCDREDGHKGSHHAEEDGRHVAWSDCPALSDAATPCTGWQGHPLPHRDAGGYEWDVPDAVAIGPFCAAFTEDEDFGAPLYCDREPGHPGSHRAPGPDEGSEVAWGDKPALCHYCDIEPATAGRYCEACAPAVQLATGENADATAPRLAALGGERACGASDLRYVCTAQRGHDGPGRIAYGEDGGAVHSWPVTAPDAAAVIAQATDGDAPKLRLEVRDQADGTVRLGDGSGAVLMMTPALGGDYWTYRVRLSDTQAIVGFPKFGTIGIGFAVEEDWNTNLPYTCDVEKIWQHIDHNKGDDAISDDDCREAIRLIREAAMVDRATEASRA